MEKTLAVTPEGLPSILLIELHNEVRALRRCFDIDGVAQLSDWTFENHLGNVIEHLHNRAKTDEFFDFYVGDCMEIFAGFDGTDEVAERYARALVEFGRALVIKLDVLKAYDHWGHLNFTFGRLHQDDILLYLIEEH